MNLAHIPINEVFGPTVQGEGLDIGRPCVFIRVHHCPVKCPGCDTSYTWNGTEDGIKLPIFDPNIGLDFSEQDSLEKRVGEILKEYPGCGIVLSGGEPLLYYRDPAFRDYLTNLKRSTPFVSIETSGFIGNKVLPSKGIIGDNFSDLDRFFSCFTSVHLSPKITPCLHGTGWSDDELTTNIPSILNAAALNGIPVALKFVARDETDINAIDLFLQFQRLDPFKSGQIPIYLMPYGQEKAEVAAGIERLIPFASQRGWIITPRLQCLLWGKKRGV